MSHCVASYTHEMVTGRSAIYSLQYDGKRLATVQFRKGERCFFWMGPIKPMMISNDGVVSDLDMSEHIRFEWSMAQARMAHNKMPTPPINRVISAFLKHLNNEQPETGSRAVDLTRKEDYLFMPQLPAIQEGP
jgi:hypothetical protein